MNRLLTIFIFIFQLVLTFVLMFCVYMVFALLDYQSGIDGLVGLPLFQPVFATIISIVTISLCFVAGLPIRLHRGVREWWVRYYYIAIIGIVAGFVLLALSLLPQFQMTVLTDGQDVTKQIPNIGFVMTGWFILAFSTLHLFPPEIIIKKIKKVTNQYRRVD